MREFEIAALFMLATSQSAFAATNAIAPAVQDTWVTPANPTSSAGGWSGTLVAGPGEIFVQLRLPRLGWVRAATLTGRAYTGSGSVAVSRVHDDAWSESTTTWDTRPQADATPLAVRTVSTGAPLTVDLTSAVQDEQLIDSVLSLRIAVTGPSDTATYQAHDGDSANCLRLELELAPAPRLEAGDLVIMEPEGPIVAIDPTTLLRKRLATPARVGWALHAARDPNDGSTVVLAGGLLFRIDAGSGEVESIGEELSGGCFAEGGLAVASDGGVLITARCPGGYRVLRIDPQTGAQQTLVATGLGNVGGALAIDRDGTLLTVSFGGGSLVRSDPVLGTQSIVATSSLLAGAIDVHVGAEAYWVSGLDRELARVDRASGAVTSVAAAPFAPHRVIELPDGRLLLGEHGADPRWGASDLEIGVFNPASDSYVPLLVLPRAGLAGFTDWTADSILVAWNDPWSGPILSRLDLVSGSADTLVAPLSSARDWIPDLVVDADRAILHLAADRIVRIDPATGTQSTIDADRSRPDVATARTLAAGRLFHDLDGRLLATEWLAPPQVGTRIVEVAPSGARTLVLETPVVLDSAVAEGSDSFLGAGTASDFVGAVWRIDRASGDATVVSSGGNLLAARDLVLEPTGSLLVAMEFSEWLVRIDPVSGDQSFGLLATGAYPQHLVRASSGLLYASSPFGVTEVDPTTEVARRIATSSEVGSAPHALGIVEPRCADGWDNDQDGAIDYPADNDCASAEQDRETPRSCGVGAELPLILAAAAGLARRPRWRGVPSAGGGEER